MALSGTGAQPRLFASMLITGIALLSLPQPARAQSRRNAVPTPATATVTATATTGDDFKTFNNPEWTRFGGNQACVVALNYDDWSPYGEPDIVRLRQLSTVVTRAKNFCNLEGYPYLIPDSYDIQRLSQNLISGSNAICNDVRLADTVTGNAQEARLDQAQVSSKFFIFTTLTCSLLKPTPDSNPNLVQELKGYKVGQKVFFVAPSRDASYGDLEIQALNKKDLTARVMSSKADSVMTVALTDLKADQTSGVSK